MLLIACVLCCVLLDFTSSNLWNFTQLPVGQQRRFLTTRHVSSGFLLFNAEATSKEKFMLSKLFDLLNEVPKEFKALDWQPQDSRGTRYFNAMDNRCVEYIAAGREDSWSDAAQTDFKSKGSRDQGVPISFIEFEERLVRLPLDKGSVDVAMLQPGAADAIGPKNFRLVFRETSRLLKPNSRFLVFIDSTRKLPATAANYFDIERRFKRDTTRCYRLIRKIRKRPRPVSKPEPVQGSATKAPVKAARLKRPKALSVDELQSALVDDEDNEDNEDNEGEKTGRFRPIWIFSIL